MKNLILMVLIIGLVGCDREYPMMTEADIIRIKRDEIRNWQRTKRGVRYFIECVEGLRFIATDSTHGYLQLAGPIGECTEGDN